MIEYGGRHNRPRRPLYSSARHHLWVQEFRTYLRATFPLGVQLIDLVHPRPAEIPESAPTHQRSFVEGSDFFTASLELEESDDEGEAGLDLLSAQLDSAFGNTVSDNDTIIMQYSEVDGASPIRSGGTAGGDSGQQLPEESKTAAPAATAAGPEGTEPPPTPKRVSVRT